MQAIAMRVGALSRKTGVSIRTLHYYDEIGLLRPSRKTEAGHRLYTWDDIARLQQILSLRQIGFSLEEIRSFLDDPECTPGRVIALHMERLRVEIEAQQQLYRRLETLAAGLRNGEEVTADTILKTIEAITMYEKYYTPEQMKALDERAKQLGEDGMQKAQQDWETLYARVREEMEKGTDPTSEPVLSLARRANELIQAFTGGDPQMEQSLNNLYQQEGPEVASRGMIDPALWEYFGRAMQAVRMP